VAASLILSSGQQRNDATEKARKRVGEPNEVQVVLNVVPVGQRVHIGDLLHVQAAGDQILVPEIVVRRPAILEPQVRVQLRGILRHQVRPFALERRLSLQLCDLFLVELGLFQLCLPLARGPRGSGHGLIDGILFSKSVSKSDIVQVVLDILPIVQRVHILDLGLTETPGLQVRVPIVLVLVPSVLAPIRRLQPRGIEGVQILPLSPEGGFLLQGLDLLLVEMGLLQVVLPVGGRVSGLGNLGVSDVVLMGLEVRLQPRVPVECVLDLFPVHLFVLGLLGGMEVLLVLALERAVFVVALEIVLACLE